MKNKGRFLFLTCGFLLSSGLFFIYVMIKLELQRNGAL